MGDGRAGDMWGDHGTVGRGVGVRAHADGLARAVPIALLVGDAAIVA